MRTMPMKQWFFEAAMAARISPRAVITRYYRRPKRYRLNLWRINRRVVLVLNPDDGVKQVTEEKVKTGRPFQNEAIRHKWLKHGDSGFEV